MNICLQFIEGSSMIYNEKGILLQVMDGEGNVLDTGNEGEEDIVGLWNHEKGITLGWSDVVEQLRFGIFPMSSHWYLHNGQVIEEGKIADIIVDGTSLVGDTGGKDVSGYTGDNNVYCESCEIEYEVRGKDTPKPTYCTFCGQGFLLTKEDY